MHQFRQVDVFGSGPLTGNPVAVVHDADDLDDDQMQLFAQWTNLSETTFLLRPDHARGRLPAADLHRRAASCRSPATPRWAARTPGSRRAVRRGGGHVVQECGAGLVTDRAGRPAGVRRRRRCCGTARSTTSDLDHDHRRRSASRRDDVVDAKWSTTVPGWVGVLLARRARRPRRCSPTGASSTAGTSGSSARGATAAPTPTSRCAPSTPPPRTRSPAASTPASASGWPAPCSRSSTSPRRAPRSAAAAGCT